MGICNPAMVGVVAQFARPTAQQVALHSLVVTELSAFLRILRPNLCYAVDVYMSVLVRLLCLNRL